MINNPTVKRFSGQYWKNEIGRAEERSKRFIESAEESIRVYNAQKQIGILNDTERRINVWWYCVNTLLPAYYSSTPKAEVSLRKRAGGLIEELSAVLLERNIQYNMDVNFNFDSVGYNAALQFLLTGRAVLWARYDAEIEDEEIQIALFDAGDGTLLDDKGQPFTGDIGEIKDGPGGLKLVNVGVSNKTEEYAVLDVVQYNDYLCSDARNESEIEWRARRAFLNRQQATDIFGADIADTLSYDSFPDKDKRDWNRDHTNTEGKAELYEIWCEESYKVYWLHKPSSEGVIFESEPPIDFEDFYPCSVIAQSADPDSVIPVSDYSHVKDQVLEVERLTTRIHAVTQAIRTNTLYDASLGIQVEQLMTGDLKMIPVMNWPSYKSRGGLQAGIETMDIQAYVGALQTLQAARQQALEQLYETLKVSDLLRGTSEQYKSATANRLENAWSSLGLIVRQNMFVKFMSDGINKLGQIIATQFEPELIFDCGDANRLFLPLLPNVPPPPAPPEGVDPSTLPPPPPPPSPEMLMIPIKQKVIDLLRSDDRFQYRIQIASDSMVAIDQMQDQAEGAKLMGTCGEFFNQMRALIEQYPPLLQFSIELFQNVIKRFKGGKELDGIFTKALQQVGDIAKAKEEAAKQPPPPDPVMQEMQARMQIAQMEAQARIQATQMQMQDAAQKNQIAMAEQQVKMQREQLNAQLDISKQQFDQYIGEQELVIQQQEAQIKANSVQVDMLKVQTMAQSSADKHAIQQETNRMAQILEIQKLELEQMRIRLSESEKLMEERRLAAEQQIERLRVAMDTTKLQGVSVPQQPIVINNVIPKRAKRVGKISLDELGNTSIEIDDANSETEG
jgi:hypothetical protein